MAKLGVPMFASEVYRTPERQLELYTAGHSKAKDGQSAHQTGCAIDLIHTVKGWGLAANQWALIGHVGKELATQRGFKLTWGGDWNFYDPAHWEVTGWKAQADQYPFPTLPKGAWTANWREKLKRFEDEAK